MLPHKYALLLIALEQFGRTTAFAVSVIDLQCSEADVSCIVSSLSLISTLPSLGINTKARITDQESYGVVSNFKPSLIYGPHMFVQQHSWCLVIR